MTNAEFPDDGGRLLAHPPQTCYARATPIPMSRAEDEDDDNEASLALEAAEDFADAGKYAEALERHEWYHRNALRIDPAQSGVRLSFALSSWKELADQYPPALASLKAIRDANIEDLLAGKGEADTFHDVACIDTKLGEEAATVTLFKALDARQPAFAAECFRFVQETLLDKDESELFTKHSGDFVSYLKGEIGRHDRMMEWAKSKADDPMPKEYIGHFDDEPIETTIKEYNELVETTIKEIIKKHDDKLVGTTLKLVAFATKQGDNATVNRLKDLAFQVVPDPRIQP